MWDWRLLLQCPIGARTETRIFPLEILNLEDLASSRTLHQEAFAARADLAWWQRRALWKADG